MSNVQDTTNEEQPLTYTQRLIKTFTDSLLPNFSAEDVERMILDFTNVEMEKKKHNSDMITFGKYRYKTVKEVVLFDPRYCSWLVKQEMLSNYPELKVSLELALKK